MKAPLLRDPNSEIHQHDRFEPVQAAPPDLARSIYRIGVPRLESVVSHLHLAQMRGVNWLGDIFLFGGAFIFLLGLHCCLDSLDKLFDGLGVVMGGAFKVFDSFSQLVLLFGMCLMEMEDGRW